MPPTTKSTFDVFLIKMQETNLRFQESIRTEFREQWKQFQEHCRQDMTSMNGRVKALESWKDVHQDREATADKQAQMKPAWTVAAAKALEVAIILGGVVLAMYAGHRVW